MDSAGLIAAGIAAAVVYRLAGNGWFVPNRRSAMQMAFAFLLSVQAVVLLSTVYSSVNKNRDLALHLETRLTYMEQIIGNLEKHNSEMMSNLANNMLTENPGEIKSMATELITPDSTHGSEEDDQPRREDNADQEFTDRSEEAAPSPDDETTTQHKPWRVFTVPEDRVFVVECAGEKLRLHIRSASDDLDHQVTGNFPLHHNCGQTHEAGTPSTFDGRSYRALFWSLPGEERVVPAPWPRPDMWHRLTAAMMQQNWEENPPVVEEKTPPMSFTVSADEVLFCRPSEGRTTRVIIAPSEDVVHVENQAGPVVSPLAPHSVLPISFADYRRALSEVVVNRFELL